MLSESQIQGEIQATKRRIEALKRLRDLQRHEAELEARVMPTTRWTRGIINAELAVCKAFEIDRRELHEKTHRHEITWPRQVVFFLASRAAIPKQRIAKFFGCDHTTVLYGCRAVRDAMDTNPEQRGVVEKIAAVSQNVGTQKGSPNEHPN